MVAAAKGGRRQALRCFSVGLGQERRNALSLRLILEPVDEVLFGKAAGGLNLVANLLGKPGKMEMAGDQVYRLHCEGRLQEINDYCLFDTLDTYFVFLRTRVLTGDLALEQEEDLVRAARNYLQSKAGEFPALVQYLQNWP